MFRPISRRRTNNARNPNRQQRYLLASVLTLLLLLLVALNIFSMKTMHVTMPVGYDEGTIRALLRGGSSVDFKDIRVQTDLLVGSGSAEPRRAEPNGPLPADQVHEATDHHKVAGLICGKYGGPADEIASEMVYWSDLPSDARFVSPFHKYGPKNKYLTFEPDEGGWNNIRMSMETAVAMAHAMGRTLVMPPEQTMYLLAKNDKDQKNRFSFADFFHFESVAEEHPGVEVISTQEFLEREVVTGNIRAPATGDRLYPPENRTDWNGIGTFHDAVSKKLGSFMRTVGTIPQWNHDKCIAVFPKEAGSGKTEHLEKMAREIVKEKPAHERMKSFYRNPTPVDAPAKDRMREDISYRSEICVYNENLQNQPVVHFLGDNQSGIRLLVHFYALLFFEDWKQGLWMKRFIRDHLRYVDEIQCAAARVVNAVREVSRRNGDKDGNFDTLHIRRGDFQYKETRIEADQIYENAKDVLVENATVYIATDERNATFFDPLRRHYKLYFLDDFKGEVGDINTNFYGMLDQRIASRGRVFVGTYYSTFTGYIHRMRGYHSQKDRTPGYEKGEMRSYYFAPVNFKHAVSVYEAPSPPLWAREFPSGWRDLDKGI